jgi:hypothetical protein
MPSVFEVHRTLESFGVLETGAGRKAKRIMAWGLGVGAAIGLAVVAGVTIATIPRAAAHKAYWTVEGPPCPQATPAQIHRIGRPLAQVVDFGEGRFSRISGSVVCTDLTDGAFGLVYATACQFAGPRALAVGSEGGFAYFDVPDGPATVTVSRDRPPRCVLAAHYKGE